MKNPSPIRKAGAVLLSASTPTKILLLFRTKQQDWSFPKGHVETGEETLATALREIKEETGIEADLLKTLPSLTYPGPRGGVVALEMFLMKSRDDAPLRTEHENDRLEWLLPDLVDARLSHRNLKEWWSMTRPAISC